MIKIDRQPIHAGEYIKISTQHHWTDIINVIKDGEKTRVSYSSGGANSDVSPLDLAYAMKEAWEKTISVLKEEEDEFLVSDEYFQEGDEEDLLKNKDLILIRDGFQEDLHAPTAQTILDAVNRSIHATGDHHHTYLEGFTRIDTSNGVPVYQIELGS